MYLINCNVLYNECLVYAKGNINDNDKQIPSGPTTDNESKTDLPFTHKRKRSEKGNNEDTSSESFSNEHKKLKLKNRNRKKRLLVILALTLAHLM